MIKRTLTAMVVSIVVFGILTFFWIPYMATDIPQRYGVPFVFREVGCYYRPSDPCIDRWNVLNLFLDLLIVIIPVYGITVWLTKQPKQA